MNDEKELEQEIQKAMSSNNICYETAKSIILARRGLKIETLLDWEDLK